MESDSVMEENRTPLGLLTPSQQNSEIATSLDFSKLTPSQFGITTNSFTAFPKDKDKSRVSQLKSRRRSTIGVRGSPETNSLICFRAKQAMKTPPRTPQHLLDTTLFSGRDSIKQKMAAFRRLMETEEEEGSVRRVQSDDDDDDDGGEERENRLAPLTPPLSKRRRRGTPHRSVTEEETPSELTRSPEHTPQVDEFRSLEMAPSLGLGLDSQSQLMSFPMLIKTGDVEVSSVSKKKRVRFGAPLSPEFFDKSLPPSTPLQKGATPACPPSSTGHKHSLLKTPQRFEQPLPQPDFSSPGRNGASPVLTRHARGDREDECDEVFLDDQKISFPIMDEEFDNLADDTKDPSHHQTLTTHADITEPSLSSSVAPECPVLPLHAAAEPEDQHQPQKITESSTEAPRSRGRKRKQPAESETMETRRSARSASESAKGKLKATAAKKRFGTKEVDRSLYGKRDYASKNPLLSPIIESVASSLSSSPTREHTGTSTPVSEEKPDSRPVPALSTKAASPDTTADLVTAAALWRRRFLRQAKDHDSDSNVTDDGEPSDVQSKAFVESPGDRGASAGRAVRGRRNSAGRRSRECGQSENAVGEKKTEVCQAATHTSNQEENPAGEPTASEKSHRSKSKGKTPEKRQRSARRKNISVSEEEEQIEEQTGEEKTCRNTEETSGGKREGTEKDEMDAKQNSGQEEVEKDEKELGQNSGSHKEAEKNDEDPTPTSVPSETLESWQQPDFCIEDVLKSVAKSRGSVRRSLRHRRSMDVLAKGLAWVEHTSPQMITTTQRRRTRGRLSAVSQPPPLPDPEETRASERAAQL
ncbi:cell division cycle-associated protein 2 isoform X1 [Tachysurus vachellii]|uniref:cell division cycle-associated protein 2 isoform X1 n=1 Tax=Tachysurus vachellii TaxID=175792 RepID=UPI00296B32C9|nr:cell division cycle-associated protein 2 isoform X1 [Tachysurus vachellii]XP_060740072.1 cell division cycle-associated protein 2 isoform X1 [Tachysurus vachellii]